MVDKLPKTDISDLPEHVAIIMDGNGRWARSKGFARLEGHKAGAESVRNAVEFCREKGIRYLTLFSFSTENWQRSAQEVSGLMNLFRRYLDSELEKLLKNDIRLRAIGDLDRLPSGVRTLLERDIEETKNNEALDLILAVSYGGREEIVAAAQKLASEVAAGRLAESDIDVEMFSSSLWSGGIPDPDLLIRTSGEMRISNFLLWQSAYSEMVVIDEFWPDFDKAVFERCLKEFATRERRFGRTSEQLKEQSSSAASFLRKTLRAS